jgi:hypothetical protein
MAVQGKRKSSWIPALLYPGLLCLAVLLGFLYYYEQTIARTQELLNDRAFRVLNGLSTRLTARIASFDTVLRQSSRLSADDVERYFEGQVTDLRFQGRTDLPVKATCGGSSLIVAPPPANSANPNAIFQIAHFGKPTQQRAGKPPEKPAENPTPKPADNATVCATVTADRLIDRFLNEPADFFDEVLLAKMDGTVLFQTSKTSARLVDVSTLFPVDKPADESTGLGQSLTALLNRVKGGSEAEKPVAAPKPAATSKFISAVQASGLSTVRLGGTEYRLYTTPIVVPVEDFVTHTVQQQSFAACGLYRSDRFQTMSKALPPVQALAVILVILFALSVAWPFFRFPFMGVTERIPRHAGLYYFLSILGATALLTILSLHVRYYTEATDTDRKLERLATTIETNVSAEVRNALTVLHNLGKAAKFTSQNPSSPSPTTCAVDPDFVNAAIPSPQTGLLAKPHLPMAQYPYFDNVFWADANGFQLAKWSVHNELTPPTRLCNFGFFQETLANHFWYFGDDGPAGPRFRIDPLYSPNTAEYLATISQSFTDEDHGGSTIRSAHMVTPLLTLVAPVLPPDFGFAIIDASGQVLFHSDPAKNGSENLFAESLDSEALQRAASSRLVNSLTVDYLGRQHRMLVSPFQKFQASHWTLIVFADTAAQRALHWSRMFLCTSLAVIYFLLLAVAGLWIMAFGQYPPVCLAPADSRKDAYRQITAVLALVCVIYWRLIFIDQERFVLYAALLIPFVTMAFIAMKLRNLESLIAQLALLMLLVCTGILLGLKLRGASGAWRPTLVLTGCLAVAFSLLAIPAPSMPRIKRLRIFHESASWYSAATAAAVIVIALLPCVAFFRLANNFEQDLFTRREQILVTEQMREQEGRLAVAYDAAKVPFSSKETGNDDLAQLARWRFLRRRLTDSRYRYDSTFSGWEKGRLVTWNQTGIPDHLTPELILLARRIPNQPDSSASADYLAQNIRGNATGPSLAPALPEWVWYREGNNQLRLDKNHALDPKHAGHLSATPNPDPDTTAVDPPEIADVQRLAEHDITLLDENRVSDIGVLTPIGLSSILPFLAIVITLVFISVRWTIRHLFILHMYTEVWPNAEFAGNWTFPQKMLLLGPPWGEKASLIPQSAGAHVVDVADLLRSGKKLPKIHEQNVVLNHFAHGLTDPKCSRRLLEILERLVFTWKKNVIIVSSIDPAYFVAHEDDEAPPLPDAQVSDEANRWAKVLYGFETVWADATPTPDENYYRVLWSTCTRLERAALYQLATEGWPNYKNRKALKHLYKRRLVTWSHDAPVMRIASQKFHDFIAKSITPQDRAAWDEPEREGRWMALRNLVAMILIGVLAAALYVAQQQTLALFTSASTLIPSAWRFISELRGGGKPGAAKGEANA